MQAKVLSIIETKCSKGDGSKTNPVRTVTEYWTFDGEKLAENDPYFLRSISSASLKASEVRKMLAKTLIDPRIKEENLSICSYCGREVDNKWNYCPKCGKRVCQKS